MEKNCVLQVENVGKFYGKKEALHNVSLEMKKGEVLGMIGHNGAGKSTLMSIITRIILNYQGNVFVNGENIRKISYDKKVIGSMIENPTFFNNLTGIENLKYCMNLSATKFDYSEIRKYVEMLELDEVINKKVKTYSLGMKKKLDFLQAICGKPQIVILDEPTNGLDPYVIPVLRKIIKGLSEQEISILMASHQLSEIEKNCDRVIMVHKGNIIENIVIGEDLTDDYLEKLFIKRVDEYGKTNS